VTLSTQPNPADTAHFTEPTTHYWQDILPGDALGPQDLLPPWRYGYPARLPDGRFLMLPIRPFKDNPARAAASLICTQASFEVAQTLARMLAERLAPLHVDTVIGLPTLGLTFAPMVARHLGKTRYVALGYSRKFWYDEALSGGVSSITSPGHGKRVYLDPNLVPLVRGKRVVLIDDAISSGSTLTTPWNMIEALADEVVACGVVMRQSSVWRDRLGPARAQRLVHVFDSPLLQAVPDGWAPLP